MVTVIRGFKVSIPLHTMEGSYPSIEVRQKGLIQFILVGLLLRSLLHGRSGRPRVTSVTSGVSLNFDSFVSYRCVIVFG